MASRKKNQDIKTDVPSQEPWDGRESLKKKDDLIQIQKSVAGRFSAAVADAPEMIRKLFEGFLEIADFMFKNTCGVGSNFRLAECDVAEISRDDVLRYYQYLMTLLGYHFGTLVPKHRTAVWDMVLQSTGDPAFCKAFAGVLEKCIDHENGGFSPVQAGHAFWKEVCTLMHVQDHALNPTGRIYYQTAPGQNLIYIVEQGAEEGWLNTA